MLAFSLVTSGKKISAANLVDIMSGRISGGKVGLAQWSNNAVPHSWHVCSEHLRFKLDNEFWDTFYVFVELYKKAMLIVA
jgi:hypothetical protein